MIGTPPPPLVVVGSFAFVGFEGFLTVVVGLEVVPAGSTAGWLGAAPPVGAAGVCVGAEALAAGADDDDATVAGAVAVVVTFLGAGLCCVAW